MQIMVNSIINIRDSKLYPTMILMGLWVLKSSLTETYHNSCNSQQHNVENHWRNVLWYEKEWRIEDKIVPKAFQRMDQHVIERFGSFFGMMNFVHVFIKKGKMHNSVPVVFLPIKVSVSIQKQLQINTKIDWTRKDKKNPIKRSTTNKSDQICSLSETRFCSLKVNSKE